MGTLCSKAALELPVFSPRLLGGSCTSFPNISELRAHMQPQSCCNQRRLNTLHALNQLSERDIVKESGYIAGIDCKLRFCIESLLRHQLTSESNVSDGGATRATRAVDLGALDSIGGFCRRSVVNALAVC